MPPCSPVVSFSVQIFQISPGAPAIAWARSAKAPAIISPQGPEAGKSNCRSVIATAFPPSQLRCGWGNHTIGRHRRRTMKGQGTIVPRYHVPCAPRCSARAFRERGSFSGAEPVRTAMRVTVCELRDEPAALEEGWRQLVAHVAAE